MFPLAVAGYAGLTFTAIRSARGDLPVTVWRLAALAIVLHVVLVWTVRYEWRLDVATRNGPYGFLIFHTALAAIVSSLVAREAIARGLVLAAFLIVSAGALGAVFRYDDVAIYRVPVIALAAGGVVGLRTGPPRGSPS
jgi:hypothetical protein